MYFTTHIAPHSTALQTTRSIMFWLEWDTQMNCGVIFLLFLLSKFFINDKKKQRITFCLFHIGFSLYSTLLLLYLFSFHISRFLNFEMKIAITIHIQHRNIINNNVQSALSQNINQKARQQLNCFRLVVCVVL